MNNQLNYSQIGEYLTSSIPEFEAGYKEHLTDNGELLPHVLFGDFTRFVIKLFRMSRDNPQYKIIFDRCLDFIEELMNSNDKQLIELASVSFLENLHQAETDYEEIKTHLREKSLDQLNVIEGGIS